MRADHAAKSGVGFQVGVASQIGGIDYQAVVAYVAVVRDMDVDHKHAVVTNVSFVAKLG